MNVRRLALCILFALSAPSTAQTLLRAQGAERLQEGASSRALSDTLRLCTLSDAEVDLFLASVDQLVLVLPGDPQLAEDLTARQLPLLSLSGSSVWAAIDGGIDCRDFVCIFKKIAIALPLLSEPDARPQGYRAGNLTVVKNRLQAIDAALEALKAALAEFQEEEA